MFKKLLILLCLAGPLASCDTLTNLPVGTSPVSITEGEAAQGIKQALEQGIGRGITTLNIEDGFLGNQAYKIFLPAEAQRIENTLRQLGMGAMVDKAITQINRGAENAVGFARPIFTDAIMEMTITDANGRFINTTETKVAVGTTTIDLSNVERGVYFVNLSNGNTNKVYRIVVQ